MPIITKQITSEVVSAIAPTVVEIYGLYKDNPAGIVAWAKAPGKKRPQYIQMPPMAALGDDTLNQIALYLLEQGKAASKTTPTK